jgi:hypothetical protein
MRRNYFVITRRRIARPLHIAIDKIPVSLTVNSPMKRNHAPNFNRPFVLKGVLLISSVLLLASGCATSHHQQTSIGTAPTRAIQIEVPDVPPDPIIETVNPAPEGNLVWVPGAWTWQDHWLWVPGHFAQPPKSGDVWVAPRLVTNGNRHLWFNGYWK